MLKSPCDCMLPCVELQLVLLACCPYLYLCLACRILSQSRMKVLQLTLRVYSLQVADISDVVRQRADALMLSGESAAGAYPEKAVGVLRQVATRIEEWCRCEIAPSILLQP